LGKHKGFKPLIKTTQEKRSQSLCFVEENKRFTAFDWEQDSVIQIDVKEKIMKNSLTQWPQYCSLRSCIKYYVGGHVFSA
jgi:hypothetical protein